MLSITKQIPMRFLTVETVATELSVHTSTVRRLIDAGTLPGVRLGDGDGRGQLVVSARVTSSGSLPRGRRTDDETLDR
jgi:excisionase family DNA binding protein